jgi:hypothetical protein
MLSAPRVRSGHFAGVARHETTCVHACPRPALMVLPAVQFGRPAHELVGMERIARRNAHTFASDLPVINVAIVVWRAGASRQECRNGEQKDAFHLAGSRDEEWLKVSFAVVSYPTVRQGPVRRYSRMDNTRQKAALGCGLGHGLLLKMNECVQP